MASLVSDSALPPVVGEGHPHLDGLALLARSQGVCGAGGPVDVRPSCGPLVAVGDVLQAVLVGNVRRIRCKGLFHLGRPADGGRASGRAVGIIRFAVVRLALLIRPGRVTCTPSDSVVPSSVQIPPESHGWPVARLNTMSSVPSGSRKNIQALSSPSSSCCLTLLTVAPVNDSEGVVFSNDATAMLKATITWGRSSRAFVASRLEPAVRQ